MGLVETKRLTKVCALLELLLELLLEAGWGMWGVYNGTAHI